MAIGELNQGKNMKSFGKWILALGSVIVVWMVSYLVSTYVVDSDGRGALDRGIANERSDPGKAVAIMAPAIEKWEKRFAEQKPSTATEVVPFSQLLTVSADAYLAMHDSVNALKLLNRRLQILESHVGEATDYVHSEQCRSLADIAEIYRGQHRYDQAIDALGKALAIADKVDKHAVLF